MTIELTEVGGQQDDLLRAFGECHSGQCSCPTDQYDKVAAMQVDPDDDQEIKIHLKAVEGTHLDTGAIATCLDYTIAQAGGRPEWDR